MGLGVPKTRILFISEHEDVTFKLVGTQNTRIIPAQTTGTPEGRGGGRGRLLNDFGRSGVRTVRPSLAAQRAPLGGVAASGVGAGASRLTEWNATIEELIQRGLIFIFVARHYRRVAAAARHGVTDLLTVSERQTHNQPISALRLLTKLSYDHHFSLHHLLHAVFWLAELAHGNPRF